MSSSPTPAAPAGPGLLTELWRIAPGARPSWLFAGASVAHIAATALGYLAPLVGSATLDLALGAQAALRTVFRGRISFVIAHRLSTIRAADRIVLINQGRIKESGTHEELLRRRGHDHALDTGQFRHEQQQRALHAAGAAPGAERPRARASSGIRRRGRNPSCLIDAGRVETPGLTQDFRTVRPQVVRLFASDALKR